MLALKENQGHLYEDMRNLFIDLEESEYRGYAFDYHKTVNKGHGRMEVRECWTISDPAVLGRLRGFPKWKGLTRVSCIRAQRWVGEEMSVEDRYHIASIRGAKRILVVVRSHRGIENELQGSLGRTFDEEPCLVRKDHGPENFTLLRHIALNLLK